MSGRVLEPSGILSPREAATQPLQGWVAGRAVDMPAPRVLSVGDIAGLAPHRERGDGGVPAWQVERADALARDVAWPTAAAWLLDSTSVNTRRAHLADLAAFLQWLDAHAPQVALLAVDPDLIVEYRESVGAGKAKAGVKTVGVPLSAQTITRRLGSLASFYGYAVRRGVLHRNPADANMVRRPETASEGKTPMRTRTDTHRLVSAAGGEFAARYPADAALVVLLFVTGMRVGEACGLLVEQVQQTSGHWTAVFRQKGGKSARLPLPPVVMVLLEPLLKETDPDSGELTARPGGEFVFVREDGQPFDRWRARTALQRAARAAGVPEKDLMAHVARATFVSLLLAAGVPLDLVQKAARHARPETTQLYNRNEESLAGHAAYTMAGLLEAAPPE